MLQGLFESLFGNKHEQDLKDLLPILHEINALESWARKLEAEDFLSRTREMKAHLADQGDMSEILPKAFAMVREAARRTLGERPYDVQILGGIALHQGRIMELKTGEGKTLSSVAPAYLNALEGRGVHMVTVNDYLAKRDAEWMGPVFEYLGLSVGYVIGQLPLDQRKDAYDKDITYGTNNEIAFDYLRDNMRYSRREKMQRGHHYCIIDEIDSILIDGARTPLIISGPTQEDTRKYVEAKKAVQYLQECAKDPATDDYPEEPVGDYKVEEKNKKISFTDDGLTSLESAFQQQKTFSGSLYDSENFEYIHYATQALRAKLLFHKDTHYVVKDGMVEIVDEFTGRILHGRRYSEGLHQAIEAKEGIKIQQRSRTLASITFQNFFRMYNKISGMTGTAATEEKEFQKIYGLDVAVIPTNRPVIRNDQDDVIFLDEKAKFNAICDEIQEVSRKGQPILVGTVSIDKSERLSQLLTKRGVRHEVLNAKNHAREALIVAEAGAEGSVTIATNMAGRGTDIKLGGNPDFRARRAAGSDADDAALEASFAKEREKWIPQNRRVKELGGLYILGTERHESRRIDNQLRGRSGRQGDPGRSKFFLSMDDELMRLFGGGAANMKSLMARAGLQGEVAMNHPLLNRAIERAQNKVEERNFEIRKHLLKFDDVLNEQRKFIYDQRDSILQDDELIQRVLASVENSLEGFSEAYGSRKVLGEAGVAELADHLKEELLYSLPGKTSDYAHFTAEQAGEHIRALIRDELSSKEQDIGKDVLNLALRREYLMNIDNGWQDHLENLEALREAVYLRSYAQKNPLLEYKLEGFQIFDEMIQRIRLAVARKLILVRTKGLEQPAAVQMPRGEVKHQELNLLSRSGGAAPSQGARAASGGSGSGSRKGPLPGQKAATVVRSQPKVGRNDPCPCGSGKKYKHCHGA
ncbi:preprotein translocase subunit SecA [Salinispira pacifica]|uniref:Protein translocase subunit SecA n=1 Tax=Salinispira pacifica TaxID=1307761 RepID=V5WHH5_9SPIO|nr:preprotein translocase subunit SecA [Salinispira pacifica]AHC14616.1 Protein export cytoplasm protein SecA ATPase RNA helicase [Salinispira pacifica]